MTQVRELTRAQECSLIAIGLDVAAGMVARGADSKDLTLLTSPDALALIHTTIVGDPNVSEDVTDAELLSVFQLLLSRLGALIWGG